MAKVEKDSIEGILANAQKKYDLHIGPLSAVASDTVSVTTGNIAIDHIIGVGGLPLGRSVELFGPPSSGKTTTALQAAAALQKVIIAGGDPSKGIGPDDYIVYFDYEHAMDVEYAKKLGLDVDHKSFLFTQPDSLETGANVARELISTGRVRLVIWDSVAAMTPQVRLDAEVGKSLPAAQAKLMSEFLVTMNPLLHEHNCLSIFVNHLMELMSMGASRPGMPPIKSTPGGRALKFYSSVRVEFTPLQQQKEKMIDDLSQEEIEQVEATNVKVRVVKNKVAPPFRQAVVRVRYGRGFDNFWTALQILVAHKKIMYQTGFFYFHNSPELVTEWMDVAASTKMKRPYVRTEKKLFQRADEYPEWRAMVISMAEKVVEEKIEVLDAITPQNSAGVVEDEEEFDIDLPEQPQTRIQLVP